MTEEVRLIDANALIDKLPKVDLGNDERITKSGAVADIVCLISSAPTIEAEPVRHGHWIDHSPINIWRCYDCSECRFGVSGGKPNYCPNCGAKMDGGESNA